MNYAPIIIPTLNRNEHFRKCLESLEKCSGAENTEVFVALDFPPSDKYIDGWKKIDEYLTIKEKTNNFKYLHVIRREHNYGLFSVHSNDEELTNMILERYDRFIFTEDDNEFSANFLEYINKGLEKFKEDPSVWCICGYNEPREFKHGDNNYYRHRANVSAWGAAYWSDKYKKAFTDIQSNIFKQSFSFSNLLKIWKYGKGHFLDYIRVVFRNEENKFISMTDRIFALYIQLMDLDTIVPVVSKVHNNGWDALGNSFKNKKIKGELEEFKNSYDCQSIDKDVNFEYHGNSKEFEEYNNKIGINICTDQITYIKMFYDISLVILKYLGRKIKLDKVYKYIKR